LVLNEGHFDSWQIFCLLLIAFSLKLFNRLSSCWKIL
jgi:hypothetical protein